MKGFVQAICTTLWALAWTMPVSAVPSGNIFVVSTIGEVDRISPAGVVTPIATGLTSPQALTLDGAGNIYVSNTVGKRQQATITRITPNGTVSVFATGLSVPVDIAFGPTGDLYASDEVEEKVYKISSLGVVTPFTSIPDEPEGIGFDHQGNLFVAALSSTRVYKITPDGKVGVFVDLHGQPGITECNGLAVDDNDNLFVNNNAASIAKITPSGVITLFNNKGGKHLSGMTFDPDGDLLAIDAGSESINEFTSSGVLSTPFTGIRLIHDVAVPEPQWIGAVFIFALRRRSRITQERCGTPNH